MRRASVFCALVGVSALIASAADAQTIVFGGVTVSTSGGVVYPAGSVTAPSITVTGDTNNGIYFPAADQVAVANAGVQTTLFTATAVTNTVPFVAPAGAVGAPSISTAGDLNNGVYFPAADQVAVSNAGVQTALLTATGVTTTVPVIHPAGAVGAPSISTAGDLNNGIYFPAADQVAISNAGAQSVLVTASAITSAVPIAHPLGSSGAPSITFAGDLDTGIFSTGGNNISVGVQGTTRIQVDSNALYFTGVSRFGNGAVGAPSVTNLNDTDTGFYWPALDQIAATIAGTQRWFISATVESVFLPRETKVHTAFASSGSFISTAAVQTTNNTQTTIYALTLSDTFVCTITADIKARETDGSNRNAYHKRALVYREGGGATIEGAVGDTTAEIESAAAWAATITVSSNDARVSVTGDTGDTVNWAVTVNYQCVSGSA